MKYFDVPFKTHLKRNKGAKAFIYGEYSLEKVKVTWYNKIYYWFINRKPFTRRIKI